MKHTWGYSGVGGSKREDAGFPVPDPVPEMMSSCQSRHADSLGGRRWPVADWRQEGGIWGLREGRLGSRSGLRGRGTSYSSTNLKSPLGVTGVLG